MSDSKLDLSKVNVTDLFNGDDSFDTSVDVDNSADSALDNAEDDFDNTDDDNASDVDDQNQDAGDDQDQDSGEDDSNDLDDAQNADARSGDSDDEEDSIIAELQTKLGYELEGEFSEDIDGLLEFTKATAEKMAQEQMQGVFGAFPDVQEYLNFRANGGDPKNYFQTAAPEKDYAAISIEEGDVMTQKRVVGDLLRAQGFDETEVSETLEDYEDAGILERHAKKALTRLQAEQATKKQQLIQQQQIEAQKAQEENERMWTEINGLVNQGSLKGITIPEREKKRFFNWMATPIDKQGNSQRAVDRAKLDQETLLALEYIVYKGLDLNKLVSNNTTTSKAKSLRSKLAKGNSTTSRMKSSKPGYTKATKLPGLNDLL